MNDLEPEKDERARRDRVNEAAVARIMARRRRRESRGYGLMAGVVGFGASTSGGGFMGKATHFAKLFCIGFAFLAPCLLVWQVLLQG